MAYKSFKSKIGMFFAGAYLLLVCVAIIGVVIGPPDAMSGLALMFAAIPWSFMLFEGLDGIELHYQSLALPYMRSVYG